MSKNMKLTKKEKQMLSDLYTKSVDCSNYKRSVIKALKLRIKELESELEHEKLGDEL
jgi:hypothetical protein